MKISEHVSLAPYTTFQIGGPARYFATAKSLADLREAIAFSRDRGVPFLVLGGGSNVLVSDAGFPGLVIRMTINGITHEERDGAVYVTAAAGESWDNLVAKTVELGVWGLENLSHIPGSVGAAPVQNIGAYGIEVKHVIDSVQAIDTETGEAKTFSNAECGFVYRDSVFKKPEHKKYVITSVTFKLSKDPKPNLSYKDIEEYLFAKGISNPTQKEIRDSVIEIRTSKFPDLSQLGTAGSFWKNPIISISHFGELCLKYPQMPSFPSGDKVKVPLAWILDKICGLKGYEKGQVSLFINQPIVLVAKRGAGASHVNALADEVKNIVKEKTGIEIEREVQSI